MTETATTGRQRTRAQPDGQRQIEVGKLPSQRKKEQSGGVERK